MPESRAVRTLDAGPMWQASKAQGEKAVNATGRRLSESRMRERLRRHVRFEVAGDGNRDMAWVIEALPKETGSKQAAQPTF